MNFLNKVEAAKDLLSRLEYSQGLFFVDGTSLSYYWDNETYRKRLDSANIVCYADGNLVSLLFKSSVKLTGPDFFNELVQSDLNFSILGPSLKDFENFLELNATKSAITLIEFPFITDVLTYEISRIVNEIRLSKVKLVVITIGCPKQEELIIRLVKELENERILFIGVGAAFNFFIGSEKRAPRIMSRFKIEWLYRFFHDPVKQGKRIILIIRVMLSRLFSF